MQVKNWARAYCPGAILGVYTDDELNDYQPQPGANVYEAKAEAESPLKEYEPKRFDTNYPKYSKAIVDGTQTADDVIDLIESKYIMTDEQKRVYRDLEEDIKGEQS